MLTIPKWGGKITLPEVEELANTLLKSFMDQELDEIWLIYSHFISIVAREIKVEKFLNIEPFKDEVAPSYIYEPDAKDVVDHLMTRYIESLVYQAVVENVACEMSARMIAMKSASDNAGELIDELQLVYNKARQASITQEISEIVGGAAAV